MENVNQIKIVITKFNNEKIVISVYSKQNGRYLTRTGKMFELLDMNLYYPLNIDKNKVFRLVNNIAKNNNEIIFNGKPILDIMGIYYDKSLINRDIKLLGDVFKIKEKHVLKERDKLNIQIARDRDFTDLVFDSECNSNDLLTSEELDIIFKQLNPTGLSESLNEYNKVLSQAIRTRQNKLPLGVTKLKDFTEWVNKLGFKFNYDDPKIKKTAKKIGRFRNHLYGSRSHYTPKDFTEWTVSNKPEDFKKCGNLMGYNFEFNYEDPNTPETLKTSEKISTTEDGKFVIVLNEDYDMKFFNTYEELLEFVKYTGIELFKIGSKLNYEVKGLLSESYKMLLINHNRPEKVKFYYAGNFVRNNPRKVVYKKIS